MQPRTILVTGGTGTLGSAIVRAGCAAAFHVVANFARDTVRAQHLREMTGCDVRQADVADRDQVQSLFESLPHLWAVIHTAAIARDGLLPTYRRDAWHETLRVNATGAFLVTQHALRQLPRDGRLILFASRVGENGGVGQAAYAASKAAVLALAKTAACEAAGQGIAVNVICPGFVPSAMTAEVSEVRLQQQRERSLTGELGEAEQVVSTVRWLLSDEARGITGQVVHCDSRI
jgi:3-oxoacyl-[acyl-carrier protein] reductase